MPRTYVRAPGQRAPLPAEGRRIRFYEPRFYDPYFFIQGSEPEKMVMRELARRGIYFEHTPQTNPINWGMLKSIASSDPTKWEADFLFPQFKIWLEVQGAYFHTLPGVVEKEALRFALIKAAGWTPIYWWDYDIIARLPELMDRVPEFYRPPRKNNEKGYIQQGQEGANWKRYKQGYSWAQLVGSKYRRTINSHARSHWNDPRRFGRTNYGLPFWEGGTGIDHLAGLRKANSNRATTPQYSSRVRHGRKSKIAVKYRHG